MKNKKFVVSLCVMALGITVLSGCNTDAVSQVPEMNNMVNTKEDVTKTQLNIATDAFAATLEPSKNWDSWFLVRSGIGETLVKYGEDGSFQPWLAESWKVSEDQLTWTIKLREDVVFSNGEKMTATKVKESIERLYKMEDPQNGGIGNPHGYMTYREITADDAASTVTIVTQTPTPDMPGCLAYPWMLIVDAQASEGLDTTQTAPVCTGPYIVTAYTADNDVQLQRNDNYWGGDVPFEKINIMKVNESATKTMALQDKSVDIALNIAAADLEMLSEEEGIMKDVVSGSRLGYAHINFESELGNDALRQAVLMAIDGQTIADVVTNKSYTYGAPIISSSYNFGYDQLVDPYEYDAEGAVKLLDEAGIIDTDGDGYRELDGEMIDIHYTTHSVRQLEVIVQAIATQLESIGIKCSVELVDSNADILNNSAFDMCSSSEVTMPTGDPCQFLRHWYSGSSDNYANYSNAEYDEIYEKLEKEFAEEKRREYIVQLQQILLDDAVLVTYGYYNYNMCTTDMVVGAKCSTSDFYWVTTDVRPAE